jgi:hypothetical protein
MHDHHALPAGRSTLQGSGDQLTVELDGGLYATCIDAKHSKVPNHFSTQRFNKFDHFYVAQCVQDGQVNAVNLQDGSQTFIDVSAVYAGASDAAAFREYMQSHPLASTHHCVNTAWRTFNGGVQAESFDGADFVEPGGVSSRASGCAHICVVLISKTDAGFTCLLRKHARLVQPAIAMATLRTAMVCAAATTLWTIVVYVGEMECLAAKSTTTISCGKW